jgi:hypothetical protein
MLFGHLISNFAAALPTDRASSSSFIIVQSSKTPNDAAGLEPHRNCARARSKKFNQTPSKIERKQVQGAATTT